MIKKIKFLENEYFWGGCSGSAHQMPLYAGCDFSFDLRTESRVQTMPLLISSKGRVIWSETDFNITVIGDELVLDGNDFEIYSGGDCLRDAYLTAMKNHFPFDETMKQGKKVPREFFNKVQFNTWMEFTYFQNQKDIMEYAHAIIDNGFDPGIIMIDEGWAKDYGSWEFDDGKFPNPKAMIEELHQMGFIVMLWIVPFVTSSGMNFLKSTYDKFSPDTYDKQYLRNKAGDVALTNWWNGYSAILDMRKECDREFLKTKLDRLMNEYGVDGFKFDGGGFGVYSPCTLQNGESADDHDVVELNHAWIDFGVEYTYHEYKDAHKYGGRMHITRLSDRNHDWENGAQTIIPCATMIGLLGYPFICPDMVGGGEWHYNHLPNFKVDQELFVRMAQVSALFPMMQFSWAPWRVLSKENFEIVKDVYKLHQSVVDDIMKEIENCEKTGEPIVRTLEYADPHQGFETIKDEFLFGNDILSCPVVTPNTYEREVVFPKGKWQDNEGNVFEGRTTVTLPAPIDKLLWFRRVK